MSEWISVDDELPPKNVDVLICISSEPSEPVISVGNLYTFTFHHINNIWDEKIDKWYIEVGGFTLDLKEVTHWMPLPEMPK